ncbi:MAG: GNAT family N-acetyltransferase [Armatimonadetes bacterium]|nr:GNAT family N-acetyltransferase [Armatimonadota bacterium]
MVTDEGRVVEEWRQEGKSMVIRTPRWSDLEGYTALQKALYDEKVMVGPRNAPPDANLRTGGDLLGKRLTNMASRVGVSLLAEADGRIVAEGTLTPTDGDGFIMLNLLILKDYHTEETGRRLMRALEEETRRLGKRRTCLTVWSANTPAYTLYTSLGYRDIVRLPDWVRSDLVPEGVCDLVWMMKDLRPLER